MDFSPVSLGQQVKMREFYKKGTFGYYNFIHQQFPSHLSHCALCTVHTTQRKTRPQTAETRCAHCSAGQDNYTTCMALMAVMTFENPLTHTDCSDDILTAQ